MGAESLEFRRSTFSSQITVRIMSHGSRILPRLQRFSPECLDTPTASTAVARDNVGNVEPSPDVPDTQTTIIAEPPVGVVLGRHMFYNASVWDGGDAGPNASEDG